MSPLLRNCAAYRWSSRFNRWIFRGRFATREAAELPGDKVVIDLLSGRMIWHKGTWCDRQRPSGIHSLPAIETYQNPPTAQTSPQINLHEIY